MIENVSFRIISRTNVFEIFRNFSPDPFTNFTNIQCMFVVVQSYSWENNGLYDGFKCCIRGGWVKCSVRDNYFIDTLYVEINKLRNALIPAIIEPPLYWYHMTCYTICNFTSQLVYLTIDENISSTFVYHISSHSSWDQHISKLLVPGNSTVKSLI